MRISGRGSGWLSGPERFSDHPTSPWYGAWYVSEVMDILTKNREVWKKTIFILTYDENDGYFDHVPSFVASDPKRPETGGASAGVDTGLDYCYVEDELRQVAAQLSAADRKKDEFLATLAHELRNPLAPIRNALQIIGVSTDHEAIEHSRQLMERQLTQMVRLVDDLMDVSRITSGKLELRQEVVELSDIVNSALETSRPLFEQMGHEIKVALPSQPLLVRATGAGAGPERSASVTAFDAAPLPALSVA